MSPTLPSRAELAAWRHQLDASSLPRESVRRLIDAVDVLGDVVATAKKDAHAQAAVHLGMRLSSLPSTSRCPTCGDGEAVRAAALAAARSWRGRQHSVGPLAPHADVVDGYAGSPVALC